LADGVRVTVRVSRVRVRVRVRICLAWRLLTCTVHGTRSVVVADGPDRLSRVNVQRAENRVSVRSTLHCSEDHCSAVGYGTPVFMSGSVQQSMSSIITVTKLSSP